MQAWRWIYDTPDKNGITPRQHLQQATKGKGTKHALLADEPKLVPAAHKLWVWWNQLQFSRGSGFGPSPLTHQEIRAWRMNMRIRPAPLPWEIAILFQLDQQFLKQQYEKTTRKDKNGGSGET